MSPLQTNRRGFTLVELLIVVGIIIILIGLTITGYQALVEIAKRARTKGKMNEIQGQFIRIGKQGRSAAALIQDSLVGHSVEFRPVQAVIGALETYWNVDISWQDVSGSATYGSALTGISDKYCGQLTTGTAWKQSHLSKLPPRIYSRWDPCLTMMFPVTAMNQNSGNSTVPHPRARICFTPGVVSLIQHVSLSPRFSGSSILTQVAEWKYVQFGSGLLMQCDIISPFASPIMVLGNNGSGGCVAWTATWPWLTTAQQRVAGALGNGSSGSFRYWIESPIVGAGPFLSMVVSGAVPAGTPQLSLICDLFLHSAATRKRLFVPFFLGTLAGIGDMDFRKNLPFSTEPLQYPYPWQNLMFWMWPPGLNANVAPIEPRYFMEFFIDKNDYLNEQEVMPDIRDPYWADLFSPGTKPAWMGSDSTSDLLFAPYKYYKAWPLYIEVKDVDPKDCRTPVLGGNQSDIQLTYAWKDEANYSSTSAILYSYAWEDTDWDRPISGTQAPIWEMPFGRHALVRRDGTMSQNFQKRPFWKKNPNGPSPAYVLEARGGTVADFSPLKTMELLQIAELLKPGESGKTVFRSERNPEMPFNDAYGNPLIVATAGFLAPRYDAYWLDRTGITDNDWSTSSATYANNLTNLESVGGVSGQTFTVGGFCTDVDKVGLKNTSEPWRPRPEYHAQKTLGMTGSIVYAARLPGGRDFLKKRSEQAYGTSRLSYVSVASMGDNREVFGQDNDIADAAYTDYLPDWVGSGRGQPLVWELVSGSATRQTIRDNKVLRAAWLQVTDMCKMDQFGNEKMANLINETGKTTDVTTAAIQSPKINGIRCICLPPVEIR